MRLKAWWWSLFAIGITDPRIHYVPIKTRGSHRGRRGNGAGHVRNLIIQQHATADWVAMIDDDDTLAPYYLESLLRAINKDNETDLVVFRMFGHVDKKPRYFPPYGPANTKTNANKTTNGGDRTTSISGSGNILLEHNNVGISFACKRQLFTNPKNPILFPASALEDFRFLRAAWTVGKAKIKVASCVAYFIKGDKPPLFLQQQLNSTPERTNISPRRDYGPPCDFVDIAGVQ